MNEHQVFESNWWSNCANTLNEELKQRVYARLMGLTFEDFPGPGPVIDVGGRYIMDIGGGPVSMLLKTVNLGYGIVVDPCDYPDWVAERYHHCGIEYHKRTGESILSASWVKMPQNRTVDEIWIYNVLQHVENPRKIIQNARRLSKVIRIFEWIDIGASLGHPHELRGKKLNRWLGGKGKVGELSESGCYGRYFAGIFKGDHYGT